VSSDFYVTLTMVSKITLPLLCNAPLETLQLFCKTFLSEMLSFQDI